MHYTISHTRDTLTRNGEVVHPPIDHLSTHLGLYFNHYRHCICSKWYSLLHVECDSIKFCNLKFVSHVTVRESYITAYCTWNVIQSNSAISIGIVRRSADFWKTSVFPGFCGVFGATMITQCTTTISGVLNLHARKQTKCGVREEEFGPTDLTQDWTLGGARLWTSGGARLRSPPLAARPLVSFQRNVAKET